MAQLPLNKVYLCDCVKGLAQLQPHSAQLIIADPPYYRVKGECDKTWPDWAAYMADAGKWAEAMARALAPNGTLLWYGFQQERPALILTPFSSSPPLSSPVRQSRTAASS